MKWRCCIRARSGLHGWFAATVEHIYRAYKHDEGESDTKELGTRRRRRRLFGAHLPSRQETRETRYSRSPSEDLGRPQADEKSQNGHRRRVDAKTCIDRRNEGNRRDVGGNACDETRVKRLPVANEG